MFVPGRVEALDQGPVVLDQELVGELLLGLEVHVEGAVRDPGLPGDVSDLGRRVARLGKAVPGRSLECFPGFRLLLGPWSLHLH